MTIIHDVTLSLQEDMHFSTVREEDITLHIDADRNFGGHGQGVRPMPLLLVSLGSCTAMDVLHMLRLKKQQISEFEVNVRGKKADKHPKVYLQIWVNYTIRGSNIDPAIVEQCIELSVTKYCPVTAMVGEVVPIETTFEIVGVE